MSRIHIIVISAMIILICVLGWLYSYYLAYRLGLLSYGFLWLMPWQGVIWHHMIGSQTPLIRSSMQLLCGISGSILVAGLLLRNYIKHQRQLRHGAYGSARWLTNAELKATGLVDAEGVFLGRTSRHYLRHHGDEHVLAFAPTRTGKGVGLVIPTLLTWQQSVLVHDIKGENWQLTSGWRSSFSTCLYFNPTEANSVCFNPLLQIRKGKDEVRDAQNIADMLVDPEGRGDKRDYWAKTGHVLLVATILHILYTSNEKTLAAVANFLSDPTRDIKDSLTMMMETYHLVDRPHPVIASSAREMLNKAHSELSGVVSTAMSFLGLYRDPMIARATSKSDFSIDDLVNGEKPVSLYLVVPPSDISRTRPLIRLILNQITRMLTEKPNWYGSDHTTHRLLLLIDEFPVLGKLDFFEQSLAYIASYGMKAYLICQSLNQLEAVYGAHHSILDNCHVRVMFASNDDKTAQRMSQLLGQSTHSDQKQHYSGKIHIPLAQQVSSSRQDNARPLMTAGEIMTLSKDQCIIMLGNHHPIRAQKIRYYEDPNFIKRVLEPA